MGMYTHLCLNAELGAETPSEVIDTLRSMVAGEGKNTTGQEHKLFQTDRWHWMLTSGGSYYFPNYSTTELRYDDISKTHKLTVNTNIKNYSGEWEAFLSWLAPFCERGEGYYRYEEADAITPVVINEGVIVQGPGLP